MTATKAVFRAQPDSDTYLHRAVAPSWSFTGSLNISFGGNFIAAEMVKAFLASSEYRRRFGP